MRQTLENLSRAHNIPARDLEGSFGLLYNLLQLQCKFRLSASGSGSAVRVVTTVGAANITSSSAVR